MRHGCELHCSSHLSFQVALGLLQFGFVVTYLSDPLVRGYTTAASVHVLVSQLKNVFGVSMAEKSGPLSLFTVSEGLLLPWDSLGTHFWGAQRPPKTCQGGICFSEPVPSSCIL